VIVCDTGPIVAAAINNDARNRECVDLFTALHLAGRRILVPGTVVAETGYLLAREGGPQIEAQFLTSLADGTLWPVELTREDYARAAELVLGYQSLPLGTTDANRHRDVRAARADRGRQPRPPPLHRRPAKPRQGTATASRVRPSTISLAVLVLWRP